MQLIIAAAVLFVVAGLSWYAVLIYNGLVALQNEVDKAWSNIDVVLKQRQDELTNLVETCKGYIKHERGVLENVVRARAMFADATSVGQKAEADHVARKAASGVFAVAELYPDLKANSTFQWLQKRISELEAQIADRREFYNEAVKNYNIRRQEVPDAYVAMLLQFSPRDLFTAQERDTAVSFASMQ